MQFGPSLRECHEATMAEGWRNSGGEQRPLGSPEGKWRGRGCEGWRARWDSRDFDCWALGERQRC